MSLCFVRCGNLGGCCGKAGGFGFDFQLPHVLLSFACFATVLPHIWNEQNEEARAKHTKSQAKLKNYHQRKVKQQNRSLQRGGGGRGGGTHGAKGATTPAPHGHAARRQHQYKHLDWISQVRRLKKYVLHDFAMFSGWFCNVFWMILQCFLDDLAMFSGWFGAPIKKIMVEHIF